MKIIPFSLLPVILAFSAAAQKLEASGAPKTFRVGHDRAYLYRSAADTARPSASFLAPGEDAAVVGQFSPRWLVVKRTGFLFLVSSKLLIDPSAPAGPPQLLDGTRLPYDAETHLITYQGVVEVPGVGKDQLYVRAHEWVAKAYRSANAVIQMQDKEAGRLVAKGAMQITLPVLGAAADAGYIRHTLTLYVKDGRYKYVLSNLEHTDVRLRATSVGPLEKEDLPFGMSKKQWDHLRRDADKGAKELISELQAAMTLKGTKDPSDF
ncbi:DUF4468 domain-containing protein [Hymenobacter convexus]|uniref:DUF4468 domain-containing protein n=1 Tax=Hymenobacter sp. CA1UV-4 TaxID=3063782 RepID=UPI00271383A1|nr:DUF4468 domain-containing protein [Hymenobacter sp. CA1UV-4]MDO7851601.1 DUF4468 domain-containing protein [Hymenobacter sp. CA1UV-4]